MRKWLGWVLGAALFLVLADTLLWVFGTRLIGSGFERWTAQIKAQGWHVESGTPVPGGWPFSASLAIDDIRLEGGGDALPGGIAWRSPRLVLSVDLLWPTMLWVAPEGHQTLRVSHAKPMVFNAERLLGAVPLSLWGRVDQGDFQADGLAGGLLGSHHPQDVRVESLRLHIQAKQDAAGGLSAGLTIRATGIGLPDKGRWPLGDAITVLSGSVGLSSPKLDGGGTAASWRDGGGSLTLHDVKLHWGPLVLRGDAKLGLDPRLQPAGSGTAVISGTTAAVDALVDGGVMQPGLGATAKAVLGAMAQLPGGDTVRLPFVLRDSTVSVGQIPLARLNDIAW